MNDVNSPGKMRQSTDAQANHMTQGKLSWHERVSWRNGLIGPVAVALGACAVGPNYVRPTVPTPAEFNDHAPCSSNRLPAVSPVHVVGKEK